MSCNGLIIFIKYYYWYSLKHSVYDPAIFVIAFKNIRKQASVVSDKRIWQPFQFLSLPLVNAFVHLLKSGMRAVPCFLFLLTWNLWSTSQLICFLKSCHHKCSTKQGMQEEIQRHTNRSVSWNRITSDANYNTVGWIYRQLVVIENWHLHIDESHLSWQFETCCSKLLNCEHAGQQTVETARWPWYVNSSPHLLSHKESESTYSMFKQQSFLRGEEDEDNRQCQEQPVAAVTWGSGAVRREREREFTHLWLSELSEASCEAVVICVAVRLDGHIQDVDGFVQHTLKNKRRPSAGHTTRGYWSLRWMTCRRYIPHDMDTLAYTSYNVCKFNVE